MRERSALCGLVLLALVTAVTGSRAASTCPSSPPASVATESMKGRLAPEGLIPECETDPCPVIKRDGITYVPLTFEDNRIGTAIVGYDAQNKIVFRLDKDGARYIRAIELDCATNTATLVGQAGQVKVNLNELKAPAPASSTSSAPTTAPTQTTPPKPPTPPAPLKERLTQADIMAVVVANKPAIVMCVNEQKKKDPGISGRLIVRWTIQTTGKTTGVSVQTEQFKRTYMAVCITGLVKGWSFPKHQKQGDPIDFPFVF